MGVARSRPGSFSQARGRCLRLPFSREVMCLRHEAEDCLESGALLAPGWLLGDCLDPRLDSPKDLVQLDLSRDVLLKCRRAVQAIGDLQQRLVREISNLGDVVQRDTRVCHHTPLQPLYSRVAVSGTRVMNTSAVTARRRGRQSSTESGKNAVTVQLGASTIWLMRSSAVTLASTYASSALSCVVWHSHSIK